MFGVSNIDGGKQCTAGPRTANSDERLSIVAPAARSREVGERRCVHALPAWFARAENVGRVSLRKEGARPPLTRLPRRVSGRLGIETALTAA